MSEPKALQQRALRAIDERRDALFALSRAIHAKPELAFEEREAAIRLTEFLGCPDRGEHLEFPLTDDDFGRLRSIEGTADLTAGDYICIHPGASTSARRWTPEGFGAVARAVARQGLRVALTLPGRMAHATKTLLAHYVIWKLRTGYTNLP